MVIIFLIHMKKKGLDWNRTSTRIKVAGESSFEAVFSFFMKGWENKNKI